MDQLKYGVGKRYNSGTDKYNGYDGMVCSRWIKKLVINKYMIPIHTTHTVQQMVVLNYDTNSDRTYSLKGES